MICKDRPHRGINVDQSHRASCRFGADGRRHIGACRDAFHTSLRPTVPLFFGKHWIAHLKCNTECGDAHRSSIKCRISNHHNLSRTHVGTHRVINAPLEQQCVDYFLLIKRTAPRVHHQCGNPCSVQSAQQPGISRRPRRHMDRRAVKSTAVTNPQLTINRTRGEHGHAARWEFMPPHHFNRRGVPSIGGHKISGGSKRTICIRCINAPHHIVKERRAI